MAILNALAAAAGARIVSVSSSGNMIAPVIFDDLHFNFLPYEPFLAYGQSKTACVLLVCGNNMLLGWRRHLRECAKSRRDCHESAEAPRWAETPPEKLKTPQQGAAISVLLATSPLLAGIGGRYFVDCDESAFVSHRPTDFSGGVAPLRYRPGERGATLGGRYATGVVKPLLTIGAKWRDSVGIRPAGPRACIVPLRLTSKST